MADERLADSLAALDEATLVQAVAAMRPQDALAIDAHFPTWAHDGQLPPPPGWRSWVIMAGRGFGKTRAGAEWVLDCVRGGCVRIALVAATIDEARRIMVEGPSGILACAQAGEVADWCPARRTIHFLNGSEAMLYSGASPEGLRGPEHDFAWCDELAKWAKPGETWDMLQFGMRRGVLPRVMVTTTPRTGAAFARIIARDDTVVTQRHSRANPYLPAAFIESIEDQYAGTRLGRQELAGELFADSEGSLWPRALIERCRSAPPVERVRTLIGVDPPASTGGTCGIVVCGMGGDGRGYVLADESVAGRSPEGWARAVAEAAARWRADRIVAERNQGGDMVEAVLRAACGTLPLATETARDSKAARAEPVAALFESGKAFFAGAFPALEAELAGLGIGGEYTGPGVSPDRADACVWALWALMLKPRQPEPRIRVL